MTAEALPMVDSLGLQPDKQFASPAPCLSWSGQHFGMQIHIVQNGVCIPSDSRENASTGNMAFG